MCGICGYVSEHTIKEEELKLMINSITYRGPNDYGMEIKRANEQNVGLAHRRLSIQDLSMMGHQPMYDTQHNVCIVFNGEIYNFEELKNELKMEYTFTSETDTEVIIYSYLKWGVECFEKFNGMFALAIYDLLQNKLILARDRIGKKPLYYYLNNNEFVFASELKPIMLYPFFEKKINNDNLQYYLYYGYFPSETTVFENVYKILPGTYMILENKKITKKHYWDIDKKYNDSMSKKYTDYNTCKNDLNNLLQDSISKRMMADVPVGLFLSGGIDSSLVVSIASKIRNDKINTFSIGFENDKYDESKKAQKIAQYLGTNHKNYILTKKDITNLINSLPYYYDEPNGDTSCITTMAVSEFASKDVTVVLSGDGGDELFCGYPRYEYTNKLFKLKTPLRFLNSIKISKIVLNRNSKLGNILSYKFNFKKNIFGYINEPLYQQIQSMILKKSNCCLFQNDFDINSNNIFDVQMHRDQKYCLPDMLLSKVDRASMKYSIEVRCPILDFRIIEYAMRTPIDYKVKNKSMKFILKDILSEYLPKELFETPKRGFNIPMEEFFDDIIKESKKCFFERDYIIKQGLFNYDSIISLKNNPEKTSEIKHLVWNYLVFQYWYMEYMVKQND